MQKSNREHKYIVWYSYYEYDLIIHSYIHNVQQRKQQQKNQYYYL